MAGVPILLRCASSTSWTLDATTAKFLAPDPDVEMLVDELLAKRTGAGSSSGSGRGKV